jgi:hypothetical protein
VLREHDRLQLVGKVARVDPTHTVGLLAELAIARTLLGDL